MISGALSPTAVRWRATLANCPTSSSSNGANTSFKPKLCPDSFISFKDINMTLWNEFDKLEPFGVGNEIPLFWTRGCQVRELKILSGGHLKLLLSKDNVELNAIYWRWNKPFTFRNNIDILFALNLNSWNGEKRLQLEIRSIRNSSNKFSLCFKGNSYQCDYINSTNIFIRNSKGDTLCVTITADGEPQINEKNISHPYIAELVSQVMIGFGLKY